MAKIRPIDLLKQKLEIYLSSPKFIMEKNNWSEEEYNSEVSKLEESIQKSKRGKSSRNKGSSYERTIAKKFKEKLNIDLVRTPQSGGFAKKTNKGEEFRGDITTVDKNVDFKLHLECKDHTSWSLPAWIRQAEDDCPEGKIPAVIFHRRQKNQDGKRVQDVGDFIALPIELFLEIVDRDKIIKEKKVQTKKVLRKKEK